MSDPLPTDGPGDPIPGDEDYEYPRACCANAHAHPIQQCPAIRALLFSPFSDACRSCGDPTPDGLCCACQEAGLACPCGAPAVWEVPFMTNPEYEYYCAACMPDAYVGTPIFSTDRIIANVLDRLAHPHPCSSCGDLTAADICATCQETGERDRWGIALDLRASIRQDAAERVWPVPF